MTITIKQLAWMAVSVFAAVGCAVAPESTGEAQGELSAQSVSSACATLFPDPSFGGTGVAVHLSGTLSGAIDNTTSSVTVTRNCSVALFDSAGSLLTTLSANATTLPIGIDNRTHAYQCDCPVTCPVGTQLCGDICIPNRILCQ